MPRKLITTRATTRLVDDPIVFTLAGSTLSGGTFAEDFQALPALTIEAVDVLGAAALKASDPNYVGRPEDIGAVLNFMHATLMPGDAARFETIVRDREYLVDIEDIREAIEFVVEALSGRPTNGPANSRDGRSNTSSTSAAGSSSPATARIPSLPSPAKIGSTPRSPRTSTGSSARSTSTGSSSSSRRASRTRTSR